MKRNFIIAFLILCASGFTQTVTNTGVDLTFDTNLDNSLRISWKVDENLRTNGISPYTNIQPAITYKQFLGEKFGNAGGEVDGTINQIQEIALITQIRILRSSDPLLYRRVFRVAFGKE